MMHGARYIQTLNPYGGLAESIVTGNVIFAGDAFAVNYSVTSSSATASRYTVQGHNGDGFETALGAPEWHDAKGVAAQGLHSLDTIPRWIRFQRNPSASSSTINLALYVGR